MHTKDETVLAFCWFDKEQWELLAKIDPEGVDDSYEEWRKSATKAISNLTANGLEVTKISIKTAELQKWCQENDREPNSSSRSEYAALIARNRYEDRKT